MDLLKDFEQTQVKNVSRPRLRAGDIVQVEMRVTESGKTRLQTFEGTVIGVRGSGPSVTFTVRRESGRFGVERIFPLYSPLITNIGIVKRQKVRRAKLNYLREAGRRRVKEDERSMQRHIKEESDKTRLAEEAKKREEDKKAKEEAAAKKAEEAKKKVEEAQSDPNTSESHPNDPNTTSEKEAKPDAPDKGEKQDLTEEAKKGETKPAGTPPAAKESEEAPEKK